MEKPDIWCDEDYGQVEIRIEEVLRARLHRWGAAPIPGTARGGRPGKIIGTHP